MSTTVYFTKQEKNSQKMTVVFCDKVIVNRQYNKTKGMVITSIVLVENKNSHNTGAEYHTLVNISSDGSIIYDGEKYSGWSCGPSKTEDFNVDLINSSEEDFDDYIGGSDSEWWDSDFEEV